MPIPSARRAFPADYRVKITAIGLSLATVAVAMGQPVTTDSAVEELRKRVPSGANDQKIVDDFLSRELATLTGASDRAGADRAFRDDLRRLREASDSTGGFRDFLADRFAILAKTALDKKEATPPHVSNALLRALGEMRDKRTVPGLLAGLTYPSPDTRYLAARGMLRIRDRLTTAERGTVVAALRQAGVAETNPIVVERIYTALAFSDPPVEALDAIIAILTARVEAYRQHGFLHGEAESVAMEYLANAQLPAAQKTALVLQVAPLLRMDVERFARGGLSVEEEDSLARRIYVGESLLETVTGLSPGNIREKMQSGGLGAETQMQLELLEWIGSPDQAGALSANPWNVPRGAP